MLYRAVRDFLGFFWIGTKFQTSILFAEVRPNARIKIEDEYSVEELFRYTHPIDLIDEPHFFPSRKVATIDKCDLDSRNGVIFVSNHKILSESSSWPVQHLMMTAIPRPIFKSKSVSNSSRSILLPTSGYYHWLLEDLPPFLHLQSKFPDSQIIVNSEIPSYVRSLISYMHLQPVHVPHHVSVSNYTFVTRNTDVGWPHNADVTLLQEFFSSFRSRSEATEQIYISRVCSTRSPEFEYALSKKLEENGWTVLEAEKMDFLEQIKLISSAKVLCGVGGAGLSGCVWMNPDTILIELSPKRFVPVFARLAKRLHLRYRLIQFEETNNSVLEILNKIEAASR